MVSRNIRPGSVKPPANYEKAGQWLRDLRRYWMITQDELAEQSGLADSAMVEWIEAGDIRLPSYLHSAFARAFLIDVEEFSGLCADYYDGRADSISRTAA